MCNAVTSIIIGASGLRDEINDRIEAGEIDEATANALSRIDDAVLHAAIDASLNDEFWHALDALYSRAIGQLIAHNAAT